MDEQEFVEVCNLLTPRQQTFVSPQAVKAVMRAMEARAALATTDAIAPTEEKRKAFETYWSNAVGLYERKALAENAFYAGTRFAPSMEAPAVDALTTVPKGFPKDGDSEETRIAFRDYDQRELTRTKTPWQIWRDAIAYCASAPTCPASEPKVTTGGGARIDLVVALQSAYQRATGTKLADQVAFPMADAILAHPASEPKALTDRYVQRYNEYSGEGGGVCENDEGEYVKYSDYIALLADRGSEQS